ncbi:CBS domain-containing protein [bacterium]|nr:CBS domain-containing protein [bacterium]
MAWIQTNAREPVSTIMSRKLLSIAPTTTVAAARQHAAREAVEHLLVLEGDQLVGVVCRCDLERARPRTKVGTLVRKPLVSADAKATIGTAAELMRTKAVGCLPVLSGGLLLGVVTRSDMLRSGVAREALGGPCVGCGSQHGLSPGLTRDEVVFCSDCLECRGDVGEGD